MTRIDRIIRKNEDCIDGMWPLRTQSVSYDGDARVIQGNSDFSLDDLNMVRDRFPERRVTLDGDVITVRPKSRTPPQGYR
ncbi:hypothetical protein [Streptomyces europaeiscabiei]|uniref:hypothetical protein n=1 Tax=Streptomyces europaeiscabiei TaxID=146819 RepID=UPI002E289043|nr:hypothetical protein [Streptomyces europaeiscabiei]